MDACRHRRPGGCRLPPRGGRRGEIARCPGIVPAGSARCPRPRAGGALPPPPPSPASLREPGRDAWTLEPAPQPNESLRGGERRRAQRGETARPAATGRRCPGTVESPLRSLRPGPAVVPPRPRRGGPAGRGPSARSPPARPASPRRWAPLAPGRAAGTPPAALPCPAGGGTSPASPPRPSRGALRPPAGPGPSPDPGLSCHSPPADPPHLGLRLPAPRS